MIPTPMKKRKIRETEDSLLNVLLAIPLGWFRGNDDRISELPDEILSNILLCLPLKEAASTCVLSRRWRNIWSNTWPIWKNLNFDFPTNYYLDQRQLDPLECATPPTNYQIPNSNLNEVNKERERTLKYVERLVENYKGPHIDQFRISFDLGLDIRYTRKINEWIKFAMKKRVKILQLDFQHAYARKNKYNFPKTVLGLKNIGYESIQVLELKHMNVRGEILDYFLSHCPLLERLTVHGSGSLTKLRVVGTSLALKYLDLRFCRNLKSIEIRDSNIVSFYVSTMKGLDILLKNVPKLVEVSIPLSYVSKLSDCFSQLQILKLNMFSWNGEAFPMFINLKHLELIPDVRIRWFFHLFNSLMTACPFLETIVLKMPPVLEWDMRSFYARNDHVKVVKILGYSGSADDIKFINYFVKNASSIEKIIVDTRKYYKIHRSLKDIEQENEWRTRTIKQLKFKIPSTIKFICL